MKYVRILVLSLVVVGVSCVAYGDAQLKQQANRVISKVDDFHEKNQRLPRSLSELGIKETEEGSIYYQRTSDSKFIVWFGKGLGESVTFDSETRKWTP